MYGGVCVRTPPLRSCGEEIGGTHQPLPYRSLVPPPSPPIPPALLCLYPLVVFLYTPAACFMPRQTCSLAHAVMYRHGDVVIRPLVEAFRLEESLALLLETRSSDLSYEQVFCLCSTCPVRSTSSGIFFFWRKLFRTLATINGGEPRQNAMRRGWSLIRTIACILCI